MSTYSQSDDELGARQFVEELNEIRQIAEMRMMEYDQVAQLNEVVDRIDQTDVQEAHIQFQAATTAYIAKLRPYLRNRAVYESQNLLEERDTDAEVTMADIIASQGETVEQSVESGDMFDPKQSDTIRVPDLVPPPALRNAVYVLMEHQKDLGFLPQERERVEASDPF